MTTIYLSSTYEDLKDYRNVVFDDLRKAGYEVIAMKDYVATDKRPVDKCLADVARADIYVGIFVFRYGYVPPDAHDNLMAFLSLSWNSDTHRGESNLEEYSRINCF